MFSITLSRAQYDWLISNCPNWVELRWREYSKQWGIGGVTLQGTAAAIENLICQLEGMKK